MKPSATAEPDQSPLLSAHASRLAVAALLLLHVVVGLHTAWSNSVTHDEIWHLPVGVRNLQGDFAADVLNPPVTRMWAAVPLVVGGAQVDAQLQGPELGKNFVLTHREDFQRWYRWGRVFNLAWSVATGLLLYVWSRSLFGSGGGLLTLLLYVTCPNLAAHANLVTPDVGVVFGFVATLFLLDRWTRSLQWRDAILLGAALGVAEGIKYTAILLAPVVVLATLISLALRRPQWKRAGLQFLGLTVVSLLVLMACYRFQGVFQPLAGFQFQSTTLRTLQNLLAGVPVPIPLPADYLRGVDAQRIIMEGEHAVFLDGVWSLSGFRNYYLCALLYKLPHITQILILAGMIALLVRYRNLQSVQGRILGPILLPIAVVLGVASLEQMQLGLRYALPVLALLMVIAGAASLWIRDFSPRARQVFAFGATILCLASLRHHPHHLAYFNELAGGPVGGRAHLIDSNLDWGQDLELLQQYLKEQGIERVGLAYFGTLPPFALGIDYTIPPGRTPEPGTYAVSVNFVMGRPHGLLQPDGSVRAVDFNEFGYFRAFEPVTTLGGSIDVYQMTEADIARAQQGP
ncbi:ArnT family glycosyltransferase [Planctomicrobium sp. SH664]|uniref:ArnT family glycosyltransferase n=1 Tax=Planctomicrobium sp. SH664 TaxID=3448125 RepID=UPI003F5C0FC5